MFFPGAPRSREPRSLLFVGPTIARTRHLRSAPTGRVKSGHPEAQPAEQPGIRGRLDGGREDAPLPPLVGARGDVLVGSGDQLGGEVEWNAEVLCDRVRLERAIGREVREALVGRVVAVGEVEGVGDVARLHCCRRCVVGSVKGRDGVVAE